VLLEQHGDLTRHAVINADLRDPDRLWQRVIETGVIDLGEPIAVLLIAVLHVQQPGLDGVDIGARVVARYRELLSSGSYLAISHITDDGVPAHIERQLADLKKMYDASSSKAIWRSRDEIHALFGDFQLVAPGMSWTASWHPEESSPNSPLIEFDTPAESGIWAGLGRKP
jgi:hypothetical protein